VAPRACVRVYARVLVLPNLYIHTYMARRELFVQLRRLVDEGVVTQPVLYLPYSTHGLQHFGLYKTLFHL